jgi:hypothetical protein
MPRWDPPAWNEEDLAVAKIAARLWLDDAKVGNVVEATQLARELLREATRQREKVAKKS